MEESDVEMLRFREARRKERAKMKHVGSDQCKDAKRRQDLVTNLFYFLSSARLSRAQNQPIGRITNELNTLCGLHSCM